MRKKYKAKLQNEAYFIIYHLNMQVSMGKGLEHVRERRLNYVLHFRGP